METEKETVTEGKGQDEDIQTEQAGIKVENTDDGTTTVVAGSPLNTLDGTAAREESTAEKTDNGATTRVENNTQSGNLDGTGKVQEESQENVERKPEVTPEAADKREVTPESNDFIEFEFSPIKKAPSSNRDGSSSPDAEEVLDQLYEAAMQGDSGKVCNLIFSGKKPDQETSDECLADKEKSEDNFVGATSEINQNKAIINLLKRKTPIEKEHIVADCERETSKKRRVEPEKVIDFTNVKNIRNLGSLPLGNLVTVVQPEKTYVRRKNPHRTPTPPNLSPTPQPVYRPRVTVKNLLNSIEGIPFSPQQTKLQKPGPTVNQNVEKNLIDYSVLTKALTKTLESKLKEGEDNDVKIVIFCNNKPIQSFSVRSNAKAGIPTTLIGSSPTPKAPKVSSPPGLSTDVTEKLLKMPVESVTTFSDILSHNPTYISRQLNQNLGLTGSNVPTIGDIKAILDRNRRIANESLARLGSNRTKTKRIPDEKLNTLLKELQSQNSDSDTDSNSTPAENWLASKRKHGPDEEDLGERNLVINDSVVTDENCNESIEEVQCDQCTKTFKQQRYLNRHKIRVHSSSKQAAQKTKQTVTLKDTLFESDNTKTIEDLLATPSKSTFGSLNCIPQKDENVANEGEKLDGTVGDEMSDNITEFDEVTVKTEPVSDSEDREIQTLLADDKLMDLLEPADKNKRSLFTQDNQHHGVLAKDILNAKDSFKAKAYSFDKRPPITEDGLVEPVYVCEQCGKFYRARKTLKDHFLRQHAKDKDDEPLYLYITGNKYQCPICFNNYHSGSELVSHTKKHTGELRSVCKLCGKVYSSVHVLRRHIDNIHSDVKPRPFQCELCDYAASNKWHLKEHYRRHTGEQPYKCPVCVKSFSHQGTMNRHCKTIHKIEIPSQRPFARNNICDLPDLPKDTVESEEFPSGEDLELMCPEMGLPDSPSSENGLDIDLSIVKTELQEVDVEDVDS